MFLNISDKYLCPIAIPTALAIPWPSGPVDASTPGVNETSGWPGVIESICLNSFKSSNLMSKPTIWSME